MTDLHDALLSRFPDYLKEAAQHLYLCGCADGMAAISAARQTGAALRAELDALDEGWRRSGDVVSCQRIREQHVE